MRVCVRVCLGHTHQHKEGLVLHLDDDLLFQMIELLVGAIAGGVSTSHSSSSTRTPHTHTQTNKRTALQRHRSLCGVNVLQNAFITHVAVPPQGQCESVERGPHIGTLGAKHTFVK